jgi:DNA-binding response OmpR family regulator
MGVTARTQIPQLMRSLPEPALVPAVFLDSSTRVRMMDPREIWQLSRLVPIVVLVSNYSAKDQTRHSETTAKPATNTTGRELIGLLDKVTEQFKNVNREHESAFGEVTVNFPEMVVYRNGAPVVLTTMEFKTLKYLIQNARRVISRDELLNEVWGYENYPCTRTVDNHIVKLRQKLEREPSRPVHFRTVHGAGYKFLP